LTVSETPYSPSSSGEPAPGDLELVRAFVNTRELDPDVEEITGPGALADWLRARGIPVEGELSDADVARAVTFREALRRFLLASTEGSEPPDDVLEVLRDASRDAPLQIDITEQGSCQTTPASQGVGALIAEILAASAAAQREGEWERLKVCPDQECLWAFYDRSRNRSRHWCSMDTCGNRAKMRTYRAKQASG
jgi:predicted RNA-binding Zn ribbon-like protein